MISSGSKYSSSGGTLLIIGHAPSAEHHHADLPGPDEVVVELGLPEDEWELETSELRERGSRIDTVVRFRRR